VSGTHGVNVSIVIPFVDEAEALPAMLAHVARELRTCGDAEVIAVDGGSRDASAAIARSYPFVRVMEAPRGRATQMNTGAAEATGDVLLFLHADTALPPGALAAIADAARTPAFVYGGFRHRFSGADWRLRAISALHNFRCRVTGNYYGDQGMFVLRSAFAAVGGFPVQQVEDIAICTRFRALGAPTFLPLAVVTSSRKFERMGIWTSFARVVLILLCLRLGRKPPQAFFADIR